LRSARHFTVEEEDLPLTFDIVAEDSRGRDVLVVEVKAMKLSPKSAKSIIDYLQDAHLPARFGMVADLEKIWIAAFANGSADTVVFDLNTPDVLGHYDPEFASKRILHNYLVSLVDAWLSDIAYHWKTDSPPPGLQQLSAVGLYQLLRGGTTRREAIIETDPVH
jgi:hypothetical protein